VVISKEELNRKFLHIISGSIIPAFIFYMPELKYLSKNMVVFLLGLCFLLSILIEIIRIKIPFLKKIYLKFFGGFLRKEEDTSFTGATYIFAASFLCSIIFINHLHISFIVLNLFIFGDAIAALVGISIGRIKFRNKTIEGSMACFILSVFIIKCIYPYIPFLLDSYGGSLSMKYACFIAFLITFFEFFTIKRGKMKINDNLTAPLFTGMFMLLLEKYLLIS